MDNSNKKQYQRYDVITGKQVSFYIWNETIKVNNRMIFSYSIYFVLVSK